MGLAGPTGGRNVPINSLLPGGAFKTDRLSPKYSLLQRSMVVLLKDMHRVRSDESRAKWFCYPLEFGGACAFVYNAQIGASPISISCWMGFRVRGLCTS